MTNKIEVGDIVLAGCNKSKAEVVDLGKNGYQYVVKYLTTLDNKVSTSNRKYYYHFVELFQKAAPKLYTIHGGTTPHKIICKSGSYAWVKPINAEKNFPPTTVCYSALKEIVPEKFIYCEIVGTNMAVWKRCESNNLPNAGDHFFTEGGNVLMVLSIQGSVPEFSGTDTMDPTKIPVLKGKKIKFV